MATLGTKLSAAFMLVAFPLAGMAIVVFGRSQAPKQLESSFTLTRSAVTLHEPVYVRFTLRNTSAEVVQVDLGKNRRSSFQFSIRTPSGSWVRSLQVDEAGFGRRGMVKLDPGETYRQDLLVNLWYQFAKPGRYVVEVKVLGALRAASGATINFPGSERLPLWVRPRDAKQLEAVCASLAKTASTATNADKALGAALALSYVDDSAAVAYLARLAARPALRSLAIDGLARVAKAEGLDTVTSRLTARQAELVPLIKSKLREAEAGARAMD
ncbi:MAG TPA: hypothetical protein VFZ27_04700 [Terriglobia bacterium]|nr:hypothetical protein [Terriglobia bacterium]